MRREEGEEGGITTTWITIVAHTRFIERSHASQRRTAKVDLWLLRSH